MRSILVQGSSVEKAVEKAWTNAGMPTEFSIKILDFGKKGFLGITKKPAIISIMFEPKRQTSISRTPSTQTARPRTQSSQGRERRRPIGGQKPMQQRRSISSPTTSTQGERQDERQGERQGERLPERTFWTDSLIYDITSWLTELTKAMNLNSSFKVNVQKKIITLTFDGQILATTDDERLLFSGLSYLLIQFLKKKHKKKYQGYKIMLTSKRT